MAKDNNELLMGRYRRLYESFIFGKRINQLSWAAEAFYWRVYSVADDYGNFPVNSFILIAKAGGLRRMTPEECAGYIKEMEIVGLLRLYLVGDNDWYGHLLSFTKTQPPTGAPRGPHLGRKKAYPESPWDSDMPLSKKETSTIMGEAGGGPPLFSGKQQHAVAMKSEQHHIGGYKTSASQKVHDYDKDKDKEYKIDTNKESIVGLPKKQEDPTTVKGLDKKLFVINSFQYWQNACEHPNARMSPERIRLLESRWKDSSLDDVVLAIDGCASSDFHMGRQPNNPTKYDDILLICRNRAKIEWFGDKVRNKNQKVDDKKKRQDEAKRRWNNG